MRQILFNICGIISFTKQRPHQTCSLAAYPANFHNKMDQTEKVLDPEKRASGRNNGEWILGSDVRPLDRYRRSAPFLVIEENAVATCDSSYAVDLKLDISVGMERMDDSEGLVV